jgi:lipid-A-disaccharide synthase
MLTLLPFETAFYKAHHVPVRYVGHPLADEIPLHNDRHQARQQLGRSDYNGPVLALLPGSRLSETQRLGPLFFSVAHRLQSRQTNLQFMLPAATPAIYHFLSTWLRQHMPDLPVTLLDGHAREVITAANVVLVASGTATLETLLIKRPMVVAYKVAPVTGFILSRLISVPRVALPNLLAQKDLVPEFIQKAARIENIGAAIERLLNDDSTQQQLTEAFTTLHKALRCNANRRAAAAIAELLRSA